MEWWSTVKIQGAQVVAHGQVEDKKAQTVLTENLSFRGKSCPTPDLNSVQQYTS